LESIFKNDSFKLGFGEEDKDNNGMITPQKIPIPRGINSGVPKEKKKGESKSPATKHY